MNTQKLRITLVLAIVAMVSAGSAQAVEFNGSGFLTLAAGKKFDSELADGYYVADYGQAGIYDDDDWKIGPDSKLGLQGVVTFNEDWSFTGQIVSRGARNGKINLEWLYGTYQASDKITLQFGRKRLPLFYYSESQDIGLSMPWARLPPQAYGWDVVNFNGANMIHRTSLGEWNSTAEVFYGNETRRENPYLTIYNGKNADWDEKWNDIFGADWTLSRDWLELRFSFVHSGLEYWDASDKVNTYSSTDQNFYSVATAVDYEDWVVRGEVSKIDRKDFSEHDWAFMLGVGYRMGKWLPMLTYAEFRGDYTDGSPDERMKDVSLSLRYDLSASSAIKAQLDFFNDGSDSAGITSYNGSGVYGDSKLFTIAFDHVF